jgi:hypothetical protein
MSFSVSHGGHRLEVSRLVECRTVPVKDTPRLLVIGRYFANYLGCFAASLIS